MSKRYVRELVGLSSALLRDAEDAYPALAGEFSRDRARLRSLAGSRGLHLFAEDLPKLCKHLDRCIADGKYSASELPVSRRVSNAVKIPKLFRGLYLLIFGKTGCLKEDYDVQAILFLRQLLLVGKKATCACSRRAIFAEVEDFAAVDSTLPEPERFWDDFTPTSSQASKFEGFWLSDYYRRRQREWGEGRLMKPSLSILLRVMDKVSNLLTSTLGRYDYRDWKFRHGPGAVSNGAVSSGFNKYCWTNWSERLDHAFPYACCGFHNYAAWSRQTEEGGTTKYSSKISSCEPTSKLVAVPKTYTKPRLIACESSEQMWCQQNIWHYFCNRTRDSWISDFVRFRDQSLNQDLCKVGSLDGSLATVDLSAASDRVSCHFVGQLFRANPTLLLALQASRTRLLRQDLTREVPDLIWLRKFSTMGSACTFPVESLGFLCIALSACLVQYGLEPNVRNIRTLRGKVAVFGDDIVIPNDCRELLADALELFDFKVNRDKSFWTGRFRESCGVDAVAGTDVSPAYWRAPVDNKPDSIVSYVDVVNNFHRRWMLHAAAYLTSTMSKLPIKVARAQHGTGVFGLKSFARPDLSRRKSRWNSDLQREEVRVQVPIGTVHRTPLEDDTALLQFFTEDPDPFSKWVGGTRSRPSTRLRTRWVPSADFTISEVLRV